MERSTFILLNSIVSGASLLAIVMASILGDPLPAILISLAPILLGSLPVMFFSLSRHGTCFAVIAAGAGVFSAAFASQLASSDAWVFTCIVPALYLALAVALSKVNRNTPTGDESIPAKGTSTGDTAGQSVLPQTANRRVRTALIVALTGPFAVYVLAIASSLSSAFTAGAYLPMGILGPVFMLLMLAAPAALTFLNVRPAGFPVGYVLGIVFGFMILIYALIDLGMFTLVVWHMGAYFVTVGLIGLGLDGLRTEALQEDQITGTEPPVERTASLLS